MTPRNLVILLVSATVCMVCAIKANQSRYVGVLNEALRIVSREYVRPISEKELFERAMHGMVDDLDENTSFIPESEYRAFEEEITNEFGGIGINANYDEEEKKLIVAWPLPETPAMQAGLQPFDEILAIDGVPISELGEKRARERLRGKPGSMVALEIRSKDAKDSRTVQVQRAIISIHTVLGDVLHDDGKWDFRLADRPDILYIRITSFGDGTAEAVTDALRFKNGKPRGVILDLRNNPGGLLDAATTICDLFLPEGLIVSTRGRDGVLLEKHEAYPGDEIDPDIPLVVLVNGYSASASEIVAACMQDHGRGKVVGERTYGKGTVQNVTPLQGGRSALRLTIASYWRPSGKDIQRPYEETDDATWGVSPDPGWEVPVTEEQMVEYARFRLQRDAEEYQRISSRSNGEPVARANLLEVDLPLRKAVECIDDMIRAKKRSQNN